MESRSAEAAKLRLWLRLPLPLALLLWRIATPLINRTLKDIIDQRQPPNKTGKRFKLYYAVQLEGSPPAFTLFVNAPHVCSDQYELYVTRQLRSAFGFEGCPIRLFVKERPKSIEPVRRNS